MRKLLLLLLAAFTIAACQKDTIEDLAVDNDALFEAFKAEHLPEGARFVRSDGTVPASTSGKTARTATAAEGDCGSIYWNYEGYKVSLYELDGCFNYLIGRLGGSGSFFYIEIEAGESNRVVANHAIPEGYDWVLLRAELGDAAEVQITKVNWILPEDLSYFNESFDGSGYVRSSEWFKSMLNIEGDYSLIVSDASGDDLNTTDFTLPGLEPLAVTHFYYPVGSTFNYRVGIASLSSASTNEFGQIINAPDRTRGYYHNNPQFGYEISKTAQFFSVNPNSYDEYGGVIRTPHKVSSTDAHGNYSWRLFEYGLFEGFVFLDVADVGETVYDREVAIDGEMVEIYNYTIRFSNGGGVEEKQIQGFFLVEGAYSINGEEHTMEAGSFIDLRIEDLWEASSTRTYGTGDQGVITATETAWTHPDYPGIEVRYTTYSAVFPDEYTVWAAAGYWPEVTEDSFLGISTADEQEARAQALALWVDVSEYQGYYPTN